MKIPNRIKVRGKWVEVVWQENFVEGMHLGKWDPRSNTITIAAGQDRFKTLEIALHEFMHAISDLYDLKLTERQIERLDGPLTKIVGAIFDENKEK